MIEYIKANYKYAHLRGDINFLRVPVNALGITETSAHEFNILYHWIRSYKKIKRVVRTPSGGISTARANFRPPMYDIQVLSSNSNIELTIIADNICVRFQFRAWSGALVSGHSAYVRWLGLLKKFLPELDFEKYMTPDGINRRDEVESYLIGFPDQKTEYRLVGDPILYELFDDGRILSPTLYGRVHHIDFHSSFAGGLAHYYPEFAEPLQWIYDNRKENEDFKVWPSSLIGYFWSERYGAPYLELARDAIYDNNERIRKLANDLKNAGYNILLYNTDGIWYEGDVPYHGPGEGDKIGEWANDYENVQKFRVKSKGAYEFVDADGAYHPVIRGLTKLDRVKDRKTEWEWGDIFNTQAESIHFYWTEDGITNEKGEIL